VPESGVNFDDATRTAAWKRSSHWSQKRGKTEDKYIDVDGIKTRYFEKGSGPLVV
jgi:hypothetical protein